MSIAAWISRQIGGCPVNSYFPIVLVQEHDLNGVAEWWLHVRSDGPNGVLWVRVKAEAVK